MSATKAKICCCGHFRALDKYSAKYSANYYKKIVPVVKWKQSGSDDQNYDFVKTSKSKTNRSRGHKIKDPKPFDSNKIEWSDYLKHFTAVSEWNGWSSKQKAKQLVMSFEGEAIKLLGELSDEALRNYELLVQELNRRYDPTERAQAWKIQFRGRMRKQNESVINYAQELKRLALKAFLNMSTEVKEQWVLDQFKLGLGKIAIQRRTIWTPRKFE